MNFYADFLPTAQCFLKTAAPGKRLTTHNNNNALDQKKKQLSADDDEDENY